MNPRSLVLRLQNIEPLDWMTSNFGTYNLQTAEPSEHRSVTVFFSAFTVPDFRSQLSICGPPLVWVMGLVLGSGLGSVLWLGLGLWLGLE